MIVCREMFHKIRWGFFALPRKFFSGVESFENWSICRVFGGRFFRGLTVLVSNKISVIIKLIFYLYGP